MLHVPTSPRAWPAPQLRFSPATFFPCPAVPSLTSPADSVTERPRLLAALERFERPLLVFAKSLCPDLETARDAVQDTFLSLAKSAPAGDVESLAPWLFTVCRNRLISLQRKNQRLIPMDTLTLPETTDPSPGPAAAAEQRETSSQLHRLIATLPARQQELLKLKFQGDLSYRDIATATGLTVSNVGTLLHQALSTLRQKFQAAEAITP